MRASRLPLIDSLRGFAAIWVVQFHLNESRPWVDHWWRVFCKHGWLGVPIFFVISGYCLASLAGKETHVGAFLTARLTRIFIPYWASLAVVVGVIGVRWLWAGVNDVAHLPLDPGSLLATATLATSPASRVPPMNWVCWTLTCEVAFYLMVALGLAVRNTAAIILLALVGAVGSHYARGTLDPDPLFFLRQFPLFALGWAVWGMDRSRFSLVLGLFALVAAVWTLLPMQVLTATAVALALRWKPASLEAPVFGVVGGFSYSLYLIHVPLGCHLLARLHTTTPSGVHIIDILFDLLVLTLVSGAAWLMHRTIEAPAHRWGRTLAEKIRRRRAIGEISCVPPSA